MWGDENMNKTKTYRLKKEPQTWQEAAINGEIELTGGGLRINRYGDMVCVRRAGKELFRCNSTYFECHFVEES